MRVNIVEPPCLASHFSDFYGALEETSARNKFNPHPRAYLEEVFRSANVGRNAFLVLGSYEGKILVAHLIVLCGNVTYFLFGGSSDAHRELQPSYAEQWAAIRRAKALGCVLYNFGGVSASFDKRDEWRGLSDFKRKFGGGIVAHSEFFDAVQNPFLYALYAGRKLFQRAMGR